MALAFHRSLLLIVLFTLLAPGASAIDLTTLASESPSPDLTLEPPLPLLLDTAAAIASMGAPGPAPADDPQPPPPPVEDMAIFDHWASSVELGINGSAGNSENFNVRAGFTSTRKTNVNESIFRALYLYATSSGDETKNRFEAELKHDHLLAPDSRWSIFGLGRFEYDEFQRWKYRTQLFGGVGYLFIKNETVLLRGRLGAGITKEYGKQARNELIPEGLVGVDFEWKITQRTKFTALGEYYPSLLDFSEYRLLGRAALEVLVDPDLHMSLKLGVEDRYNSEPGPGRKRNDVDYFVALVFAF